jgi:DME family drug/metabolite transporter
MDPRVGYALAATTALIWGLVVIPVKRASTFGLYGVGLSLPVGVATLLVFLLAARQPLPTASVMLSREGVCLLVGGVCQFPLGTALYYESLRAADVSVVTPLTRLKTVVVVALVFLLGIETLTWRMALACGVGIAGAFLLTWQRASSPPSAARRRGVALALLTCCAWAMGDVLMKLGMKSTPPLPATFVSLAAGAVAYYVLMAVRGGLPAVFGMPRRDKGLFAVHGVFSFGLAYLAFFSSMDCIGLAPASVITSAWPAVSFAAGLAVFREKTTWRKTLGFALLMGSVFLAIRT